MNVETTAAISSSRTTLRNTENYTHIHTHIHTHLHTHTYTHTHIHTYTQVGYSSLLPVTRKTRSSADADKPAQRVCGSVKVT